jgi:hypothetical protein
MKALISSLLASLFVLGCSAQPAKDSGDKVAEALDQLNMRPSEQPVRIRDYQVDSWRYIDRTNLIVETSASDLYLVSLHSSCFGLQSAFAIGVTSAGGSVDKFEDIVVRDASGRSERCPISDIVKLSKAPETPADGDR